MTLTKIIWFDPEPIEHLYCLNSEMALICAHEQLVKKNWNTWDYPKEPQCSIRVVCERPLVLRMGDLYAIPEQEERTSPGGSSDR